MQTPSILLIEDNPADQKLALEAFKQSRWKPRPTVIDNGQEAYKYLTQDGAYAQVGLPDLILLDLNLPGMDGRELLEKIRHKPELKGIPIVVLTSSSAQEDVERCYELCANSYVQKPEELDGFFETMRKIEEYWFGIVKTPSLS